jgi:hypothetical protein
MSLCGCECHLMTLFETYIKSCDHLRHDLRFDLRFGACLIKRLPCRGASHANAGTESQIESQVITQVITQVVTQVDTALKGLVVQQSLD